jgi:hypothetical protein
MLGIRFASLDFTNYTLIIQSSRRRPHSTDLKGDQVSYPRRKMLDQCFNRLPDETKLIVIEFALDAHNNTPTTLPIRLHKFFTNTSSTPPRPSLFHVSRFFRIEATALATRKNYLTPLLALSLSNELCRLLTYQPSTYYYDVFRNWIYVTALISRLLRRQDPPLHLLNPHIQLLELDLTMLPFLSINPILCLSPALRASVKYMQLIICDEALRFSGYQMSQVSHMLERISEYRVSEDA